MRYQSRSSHFFVFQADAHTHTYACGASPLVVSLSLTRNVPRLFCRFRRSLSESRRVIFPKYHLPKWATDNQCWAATERHQQTAANASMAGKGDFTGAHAGKPLPTLTCRCIVDKEQNKQTNQQTNTAMCGL